MKKLFYVVVMPSIILNIALGVLFMYTISTTPVIPESPALPDFYYGFFSATFNDGDRGLCVAAEDIDIFKKWLAEIDEAYY